MFWEIYGIKNIYGGALFHMYDVATDVGVLTEWYYLAKTQYDTGNQEFEGLDMILFFGLCILSMILYRFFVIMWSVSIQEEKSCLDFFLIITDFYIIREVYHGHINEKPTGYSTIYLNLMFFLFFFLCFVVCISMYVFYDSIAQFRNCCV